MASNASLIHSAAIDRLQSLLGSTYKELQDLFDVDNASANHLEQGFSVVLLSAEEKDAQGNFIGLKRDMKITVTHRTFASVDATKVKTTLQTVYDKEAAVIDSFRCWNDKTIGLLACLPSTNTEVEKIAGGEDSFIVNTLNLSILYIN